jgi:hypothetical protein
MPANPLSAVLLPRIANQAGSCNVMLALFNVQGAQPELSFRLNGAELRPRALVPLAPVLDAHDIGDAPCTHTGLFACDGLQAGREYVLSVALGGVPRAETKIRALPARVAETGGSVHVLLASCYYAQQANPANLRTTLQAALENIPRRPAVSGADLAFFMGDQVYLDLPLAQDVPQDRRGIFACFEAKYAANWRSCLADFMRSAPHLNVADDHEFWNNYPYPYGLAANTKSAQGRQLWSAAAKRMIERYQHISQTFAFDVAPISFFVADGRSERDPSGNLGDTLTPASREALSAWVQRLNASDELSVGVYVTGQSMLSDPDPNATGSFADAVPTNYRDYDATLAILLGATRPLLLVTGDVHWGRVVRAAHPQRRHPIHEVIVSPLSTVKDQRLRALSVFRRVIGQGWGEDWDSVPPQEPPASLGLVRTFKTSRPFPIRPNCTIVAAPSAPNQRALFRGEQLAVLSFQQSGGGRVSAKVVYWMVGPRPLRHEVPLFDLVP